MEDNNNSAVESQQANGAHGVIYKITCLVSGKIYVGKTKQKLEKRIAQHKFNSKKGSIGIGAAIRKYGLENFSVEVIETCPLDQLNEREVFWICELDSKAPNGYNLTDGGEGLINPSAETRARMSANHPDISGEKNPNYGKKTPPEVCAKISAANKGKNKGKKRKPLTDEQRAKISANHADVSGAKNPNYGKKHSPETCAKISAKAKGRPSPRKGKKHTPETCAKIAAKAKGRPSPRKGKKHTEEAKAQMRAKRKAWWARKKALERGGEK